MKPSTLHSLITAKALFNESKPLIASGNVHSCSAGIILLQDSLELIVLSLLGEIGVDEQKNLESKSFDELVGELKKSGVTIPKSGTIKALNKQRVITKHYGQPAEPATVRNYLDSAGIFIDSTLRQVVHKSLNEVFLTDLLPEGNTKKFLSTAIEFKEEDKYLDCLIEIRKAFYVEYENEFAINKWRDVDVNDNSQVGLAFWGRGGAKAPYWTRNKQWITENVKKPSDYVQIDNEKLRLDAMEWGVSTSALENLRRLTPLVYREDQNTEWCIEYDLAFPPNEATIENCNECLDLAISIFLKKSEHERLRRWPGKKQPFKAPTIYIGHQVFKSTFTKSEVVHIVQEGYYYTMHSIVSGFDPNEVFYFVTGNQPPDEENKYGKNHIFGYLLKVE